MELPDIKKIILGTVNNAAGVLNPAVKLSGDYLCFDSLPVRVPEPIDLVNAVSRGNITYSDYVKFMRYHGFAPEWTGILKDTYSPRLSGIEYTILFQRKMISEKLYIKFLREINMIGEKDNLLALAENYPSVSDVVRFAVREAYSEDVVKKFGMDNDAPERYYAEALKIGLEYPNAQRYWRAHWELPSLSLGFEMFHRTIEKKIDEDADTIPLPSGGTCYNVIGKKTLEMLARTQDVMPFWRDKITEVAYHPLTRVDVRRMYAMGSIDEDEVFKSYLDQGYSQETALKLTDFVIKEYSYEMHGITRAQVTKAYVKGIIEKKEFVEMLENLKLSPNAVEFYVNLAEYDKTLDEVENLIKSLTIQFDSGSITIDEIRQELLNFDLPTSYIEQEIKKIISRKKEKTKMPSLEVTLRWLKKDIIDDTTARNRIISMGYTDEDTDRFILEVKYSLLSASPAPPEEEKEDLWTD